MRRVTALAVLCLTALVLAPVASARVLRVGSYKGVKGQFKSIQAAVDHAKRDDWILIGPGDYKTKHSRIAKDTNSTFPAGILVKKADIYIRGMNRNKVIVDGTKSGPPCSSATKDQNFGPTINGKPGGLNGILVFEANNVWVQNLTACNFQNGSGDAGNEIWWNGGADDGGAKTVNIHGHGFLGSYLNATTTYFKTESNAAQYGIFSSNWNGGTWDQTYASNFNDSGYYIGACGQQCNQVVNHAWSENNVLGYSGSNSGGNLVVKNSTFDRNQDGFDTNSQNGDNPPPQNGQCPHNGISRITHTHSCWVFMHNTLYNNNNPNAPGAGTAAAGPVGTGMSISGGRFDTVMDNTFYDNKAWGIILVPYPDSSSSPCTGGTPNEFGQPCLYDEWGDAVIGNKFHNNGGFGNATNGDIAQLNFEGGHPTDCYSKNVDTKGPLTTSPANAQSTYPKCDGSSAPANPNPTFLSEALCDTQVQLVPGQPPPCNPAEPGYPRQTRVKLISLPTRHLKTMSNPCKGVPANPWCPGRKHKKKA